jgi:putative ABC transport system permease protein
MFRYLPLIWKNSIRNRRRSTLTICSLAASMCLLGLLFAIYRALFFAVPTPYQALRLVTHHRVSITQPLPVSYEQKIRSVPGVQEITIWQWFGGTYKDARDQRNFFARLAVQPESFWKIYGEYDAPEEQKLAFQRLRTGTAVSRSLADKFGWKLGEKLNITGDIFPVNLELTLVAIFDEPTKGEVLFFNNEYLRELLRNSTRQDLVGSFLSRADNPASVPRIADAVDSMFDNSTAQTKTESEQAFALSFVSFLGNVKLFLLAICGAVTFTILLVSANTMAMSVRERIREVGIMKTLGFPNGAILGIILGEATMISLIGGAFGILLAQGLTYMIRNGPSYLQQFKTLSVNGPVGMICLFVAALIGLVSSFVPAAGAARTSILDALKTSD